MAELQILSSNNDKEITELAVSADARIVATAAGRETIYIWSADPADEPDATFDAGYGGSAPVRGGRRLIRSSLVRDDPVGEYDLLTGDAHVLSHVVGEVGERALSPDEHWLVTGTRESRTVVWDLRRSGRALTQPGTPPEAIALPPAFGAGGTIILTLHDGGVVTAWDWRARDRAVELHDPELDRDVARDYEMEGEVTQRAPDGRRRHRGRKHRGRRRRLRDHTDLGHPRPSPPYPADRARGRNQRY
jgi:hypothetical protein